MWARRSVCRCEALFALRWLELLAVAIWAKAALTAEATKDSSRCTAATYHPQTFIAAQVVVFANAANSRFVAPTLLLRLQVSPVGNW